MSRGPLDRAVAWCAVGRCVLVSVGLLWRREVHVTRGQVGRAIRFADGTTGRVYRETAVDRSPSAPSVLVVAFRLRGVRGAGHAAFRLESLLNTPLFVGFPGFVSKLWLANDSRGLYRGLYEWDGADLAESYARSLWRVLALVCRRGSIDYRVLPGLRVADVLDDPALLDGREPSDPAVWWRVVAA